jgi:hypothetical protein
MSANISPQPTPTQAIQPNPIASNNTMASGATYSTARAIWRSHRVRPVRSCSTHWR